MIDYSFEDIILRSYDAGEIMRIQGRCDADIARPLLMKDYESYSIFRDYFDECFSLQDMRLYTRWFTMMDHTA